MSYVTIVDGIEFVFDDMLFENKLKRLLLKYKYSCKDITNNHCFLSLITLDNVEVRKCLVKKLKESIENLLPLDFSTNRYKLNEISKRVKVENKPVVVYNLEEYYQKLGEEYFSKDTDLFGELFSSKFKTKFESFEDMGRFLVFFAINMARDGVFLENNATFFLVLSDEDYLEFTYDVGDDFASYCQVKFDFNSCFINKDSISLSEYYKEKSLPKILQKKKID